MPKLIKNVESKSKKKFPPPGKVAIWIFGVSTFISPALYFADDIDIETFPFSSFFDIWLFDLEVIGPLSGLISWSFFHWWRKEFQPEAEYYTWWKFALKTITIAWVVQALFGLGMIVFLYSFRKSAPFFLFG